MKNTSTQNIKLGIFIILSTILLISALYFIGNRQNLLGKTFKISAIFKNVNGLQLGNNVRFSGINVGTVKNITMINDTTICVDMVIEDKILVHLKKNVVAAIGSDGLVGSMIVNIVPHHLPDFPLVPGDTINSFSKISTADMLETLNETNINIAILTSDLVKITNEIQQGKGTLGLLIKDDTVAQELKQTLKNLKLASESASKTMNNLNTIISKINYDKSLAAVLLSDSTESNRMKTILKNLGSSSSKIDSIALNLNEFILQTKKSEGSLNYFLTDTAFVKNIDSTIINIKKGSVKLNQNLEALKHNFLFRKYFKKLEKQKLKEQN